MDPTKSYRRVPAFTYFLLTEAYKRPCINKHLGCVLSIISVKLELLIMRLVSLLDYKNIR